MQKTEKKSRKKKAPREDKSGIRRKAEFRIYPSKAQEATLLEWLELHRNLYNDALAERRDTWRDEKRGVKYLEQQNALPALKKQRPELKPLGSHALQETLRRLDRAFSAFFGRCADPTVRKKGYPRFKKPKRFKSFSYPDPAGWRLTEGSHHTHRLSISKLGEMRARGKHRYVPGTYEALDLTVRRKGKKWYATVTLKMHATVKRQRIGEGERGFDLGLESLLTYDDGEKVANPRWMRADLQKLRKLQRARSRKKLYSSRWLDLNRQVAKTHEAIENHRKDFLHKLSAQMVAENRLLSTERLSIANMSKKGGKRKRALNREILSAGWGMLLGMLAYKAAEAGTRLHVADTRSLKPTQRCSRCWNVPDEKKQLSVRTHECGECGLTFDRDENAALVCLMDALGYEGTQKMEKELEKDAPGTGATAREAPLEGSLGGLDKCSPDDPRNRQLQAS